MKKNQQKNEIKLGDHFAILGGTGSGKTTFGLCLLNFLAIGTKGQIPIYIIDSKAIGDFFEFDQPGIGKVYRGNGLPPMRNDDGSPFIIWQNDEDDFDLYEEFFNRIYQMGREGQPSILYIDELSSLMKSSASIVIPRSLDKLWKQGRGLKISVITNTQSARYVPLSLLTQVMHVIKMNLNSVRDLQKLEDTLGKQAAHATPLHAHGLFYRNTTKPIRTNPSQYFRDYKEFFKIK